ncbi:substrate-binding domain-containing protein [Flavobacterium sp. CGRL2]
MGSNQTSLRFQKINLRKQKNIYEIFLLKILIWILFFFSTNYLAQSGLEVFKENDYVLLKKLGIISFEDHDMFRLCPTSISCVSQPLSEISAKLMETMLSLLENRDEVKSFQKSILKTELIIRDSSLSK